MHEIGVVRSMLRTVEDFCDENGVKKEDVEEIVIDNGELSLVITQYVYDVYGPLIKGTAFENTKLTVNEIPGLAECEDCDEIFNVVENKGYCPNCGSFEKQVLSGQDFTIREIHLKEN